MNKVLQSLIETGIPLKSVIFHQAVRNALGAPESHYAVDSNVGGRRAEMLWSNGCVILKQLNSKKEIEIILVPHSQVADAKYLDVPEKVAKKPKET